MWRSIFTSLLIGLFSSHVSNGNVLNDIQKWYQSTFNFNLSTRELLEDTGHWNKLLKYGLWGRVAHFLVTDTDAFGLEIKNLGALFKQEYEEERYVALEDRVVASISVLDVLYESSLLLFKIRDIRDKKTSKTLGYAIDILKKLAKDPEVIDEFVRRWHLVPYVNTAGEKRPKTTMSEEQIQKMKLLLLENPEYFSKLLLDPEVMSRVSSYILQSLTNVNLIKVFETIQQLTMLLKSTYPEQFEKVAQELYEIEDEQSGVSLASSLSAIYNIMKTPQFKAKLDELLTDENLRRMHETSQEIMPELMAGRGNVTPESLQSTLEKFGIVVSRVIAKQILALADEGTLVERIYGFVEEVEAMPEGFTPENISNALEKRKVEVTPDQVSQVMILIQAFSPEEISEFMAMIGANVNVEQILLWQQKCAAYVPLISPTDL